MNYFIGYLISGEAAEWHTNLAKDISEKFDTRKIYEKLPPHITIFPPLSTDDIEVVADVLMSQTQGKEIPGDFYISDFDRFGDRVVFAKVEADQEVREVARKTQEALQEIPGIPKGKYPNWHPHATLASKLSPQEISRIWNYVQTLEKPNFRLPFDNLTLFRFEEDENKWVVEQSFEFASERQEM